MPPTPLVLSPALPSELLTYIIQHESHPTTLLICSPRADFLASLIADVKHSLPDSRQENADANHIPPATSLLAAPLYQVAIARHIRILFIPTVSHLRAYLAVFSPVDSKILSPPSDAVGDRKQPPLLLVYGFLGMHRDTSEWSAQGIGATAAGVVEAARRCGFRAVVVDEPRLCAVRAPSNGSEDQSEGAEREESVPLLDEEVPLLSTSIVKAGGDLDDAAWTGRKVALGRVLGRWFRYREGDWARDNEKGTL